MPKGNTADEYEAAEVARREKVVAAEAGCLLYQLVKGQQGQYFYLELHSDHEALETHSKNMGAKGATPLDKTKCGKSPLQIFPLVDGVLHECEAIIANVITIPIN